MTNKAHVEVPYTSVSPTHQLRIIVGDKVRFQQLFTHTQYLKGLRHGEPKMEWRDIPTLTEEEARAVDVQTGAINAQEDKAS